ncbi:MAG: T9SS type A sorting domain-containing protein [Cyclonatronaceae bacterium]
MIRGNETQQRVAKRLDSRLNPEEENRPKLVIEYESVSTSIETDREVASEFRILENYPNPFNPQTTIRYAVDSPGEAVVAVYNLMGQEVWRETRNHSRAGIFEVRFNALNLTSGIYMARIMQNNLYSRVVKITLLKKHSVLNVDKIPLL